MTVHKKYKSIAQIIRLFKQDGPMRISFCRNVGRLLAERIRTSFGGQKSIFISLTEHIGDIVAAEPVVALLHEKFPHSRLIWIVNKNYRSLFRSHPRINGVLTVTSFTEWILLQRFVPRERLFDLHLHGKICDKYGFYYDKKKELEINNQNYYNYGNLLNAFCKSAGLALQDAKAPALYLKGEPGHRLKRYLVLHTSSNNKTRNASPDFWQQLADHVFINFPDLEVVEIGFERKIRSSSENYVDQTGFLGLDTVAELIRECEMFLGVDSGFAHFANALEKEALLFLGEYNGFRNYMPYSGKFQKESKDQIVYVEGSVKDLQFESVEQKLVQKLTALSQKKRVQSPLPY